MPLACAIYGYEFTRESERHGLRFIPRYTWTTNAHDKAGDLTKYYLTGVVVLDAYRDDQTLCLEGLLSFIEHLDVLISEPTQVASEPYFQHLPEVATAAARHNGGGARAGTKSRWGSKCRRSTLQTRAVPRWSV